MGIPYNNCIIKIDLHLGVIITVEVMMVEINNNRSKLGMFCDIGYLPLVILIVGLGFLGFFIWKEINTDNPLSGTKQLLVDTHFWGDESKKIVSVEWKVYRTKMVAELMGVPTVTCVVQSKINNLSKDLVVVSDIYIILQTVDEFQLFEDSNHFEGMFFPAEGGTMYGQVIEPGKSEEKSFTISVPIALYKDVSKLSARMGYQVIKKRETKGTPEGANANTSGIDANAGKN